MKGQKFNLNLVYTSDTIFGFSPYIKNYHVCCSSEAT